MEIAVVGSLDFTLGFQLAGVLRLHNPANLDELISTMKSLLNEKEVQREFGINARTLQRERVYQSGIPYHKIGRRVFYRRSDIEEFLTTCKVGKVVRYD